MEPMQLSNQIPQDERTTLLGLAKESISHGLSHRKPLAPEPPENKLLNQVRATFVTLEIGGSLRGCIGMLEAIRPLYIDVCENAFSAAFKDPRFPPLDSSGLNIVDITISVLSPFEPIEFTDEADLLSKIRPGIDGLVLCDGYHRGTFLPAVWEDLPDRKEFWAHLKNKAGLPTHYWSETLRVERYTSESFSESSSTHG
jgi:AmmeMemoRadiSam system protein A